MSDFGAAKRAGFALAAALANDRALEGVATQLAPDEARALAALCASEPDRSKLLRSLLTHVRPALRELPAQLPVRLRVLLARQLPPERSRALLASAPMTRPGFAPAVDLLPRLLRIARSSIDQEEESP